MLGKIFSGFRGLVQSFVVKATDPTDTVVDSLPRPKALDLDTSFFALLGQYINFFLGAVGAVLLIVILYAGITIFTAQGNEEKVAEGRKMIIYGIVGVVIVALAFALVNWILTGVQPG